MTKNFSTLKLFALVSFLGACSDRNANESAAPATDPAQGVEQAAPDAAPASGNVIEVRMVTDDKGNYFEPAEVTAKPGDVVRFTLVSGVHNVSFAGDPHAAAAGLPGPSQILQLPGQSHDVPVSMAAGGYTFQCDPHAALGMVGKLTVE
jgi:plastocyanin